MVVFNPNGTLAARFATPARMRITEICADCVLGVDYDGFVVKRVLMYMLTRHFARRRQPPLFPVVTVP